MSHPAPRFARYIGIDYSGAQSPENSLKGLRVYEAHGHAEPVEVQPPPSPRRYLIRRGLAHWLAETLTDGPPTLVGIDHAFSFPIDYFDRHMVLRDWDAFLDDFQQHWPTDEPHTYVDFVRAGSAGNGAARGGLTRWRRLCEERTRASIPWLRWL
jgi:hypothetical protein